MQKKNSKVKNQEVSKKVSVHPEVSTRQALFTPLDQITDLEQARAMITKLLQFRKRTEPDGKSGGRKVKNLDEVWNMRLMDIVKDSNGNEYAIVGFLHNSIEVAPFADGHPQVSSDTTFYLTLDGDRFTFPDGRNESLFSTGNNYSEKQNKILQSCAEEGLCQCDEDLESYNLLCNTRKKAEEQQAKVDKECDDFVPTSSSDLPADQAAARGQNEIFDGNNLLNLIHTFDEETYQKARPHLINMLRDFDAAGKDLREFIRALIDYFGTGIKDYVLHFAGELKDNPGIMDANQEIEGG
ncbi:hypothetical protein [Microbulbifer thermotolerans]|uniref:hypothetical protein n=1 Tax=Microbulbifer thermotolerans TaxID=252514 RepID=UPI00224971EB|nr:hypothetical protein [Microbulbifer thermotolerans]MCX2830814.1 hypothetical protein [Microbulbifer thermotolerans]